MKTKRLLFAILAVSALVLSGCKDEDNSYPTQKELINSTWEYTYEYVDDDDEFFIPTPTTPDTLTPAPTATNKATTTTIYTDVYTVFFRSESDYTLSYNYYVDKKLEYTATTEGTYTYNEATGKITATHDNENVSAKFSDKETMVAQIDEYTCTFVKK